MDRKIILLVSAAFLLLLAIFLPRYFSTQDKTPRIAINSGIEKIEIIHFHGTSQCSSCIAVGELAEETVKTYFSEELKSGKITFASINGELPENREIVMRYGVSSSSLWIGAYGKDGSFSKEENTYVWYKVNDKQEYMSYLKGVIEKKLTGN